MNNRRSSARIVRRKHKVGIQGGETRDVAETAQAMWSSSYDVPFGNMMRIDSPLRRRLDFPHLIALILWLEVIAHVHKCIASLSLHSSSELHVRRQQVQQALRNDLRMVQR